MGIKVDISQTGIKAEELEKCRAGASSALDRLWSGKEEMTGWVQLPLKEDETELERLLNIADMVKQESRLMVVIGVGGSYTGAKAAIEALPRFEDGIDVMFAGINFCSHYHKKIIEEMERRDTILCVISKSGNTLEVEAAFSILKDVLIKKYGSRENAARRIIAITDGKGGRLRKEAEEEDYVTFEIPEDIGGRYSVLTPVGLFPMAVAGIDVRSVLSGAKSMASSPVWDQWGCDYAIARYIMGQNDKAVEIMEFYDSRLICFGEWVKQLYGESEGKEDMGVFPTILRFSTDLHSMGQFLQEGSPIFYETVFDVETNDVDVVIPSGKLEGRSLNEINRAAMEGVIWAHRHRETPIVRIKMSGLDENTFGQLIYYLETTCAVTAMLMGVNPFNQNGVEMYKQGMRDRLSDK